MAFEPPKDLRQIASLLEIMAHLRAPQGGCPWDLEQTYQTIAPYTLEEAYEVADAIERKDFKALKDELGDLLFQVVYHAQMAMEDGHFDFADVLENVSEKMVRRHPHVFGDASIETAEGQTLAWEDMKAKERADRGDTRDERERTLSGLPLALPALVRAVKLQRRAARVGFDWPSSQEVLEKINEEMLELSNELATDPTGPKVAEEFGDLLFVYANLSRHLGVDAEEALRAANAKFERRFAYIEDRLHEQSRTPSDASLEEMDRLWNEAKRVE